MKKRYRGFWVPNRSRTHGLKLTKDPEEEYLLQKSVKSRFTLMPDNLEYIDNIPVGISYTYVPKGTIEDVIKNECVQTQIKFIWIEQICRGIGDIHKKNIIHRDIKPTNILVESDNSIKITDFGQSTDKTDNLSTDVGSIIYSAPEIETGNYDNRIDIYSFGLTIYYIIYERHAFESRPIAFEQKQNKIYPNFPQNFPKDFEILIRQMIDFDPDKRPTLNQIYLYAKAISQGIPIQSIKQNSDSKTEFDFFLESATNPEVALTLLNEESSLPFQMLSKVFASDMYWNLFYIVQGAIRGSYCCACDLTASLQVAEQLFLAGNFQWNCPIVFDMRNIFFDKCEGSANFLELICAFDINDKLNSLPFVNFNEILYLSYYSNYYNDKESIEKLIDMNSGCLTPIMVMSAYEYHILDLGEYRFAMDFFDVLRNEINLLGIEDFRIRELVGTLQFDGKLLERDIEKGLEMIWAISATKSRTTRQIKAHCLHWGFFVAKDNVEAVVSDNLVDGQIAFLLSNSKNNIFVADIIWSFDKDSLLLDEGTFVVDFLPKSADDEKWVLKVTKNNGSWATITSVLEFNESSIFGLWENRAAPFSTFPPSAALQY